MRRSRCLQVACGSLLLVLCSGCGHDHEHDGHEHEHDAELPAEYADLGNPLEGQEALQGGEQLYQQNCALCHGEAGLGDGSGAAALMPAPTDLTEDHVSMASDAYLFYRISEGGGFEPYNSAMPGFKEQLDEQERWVLVNYLRELASSAP